MTSDTSTNGPYRGAGAPPARFDSPAGSPQRAGGSDDSTALKRKRMWPEVVRFEDLPEDLQKALRPNDPIKAIRDWPRQNMEEMRQPE